MVVIREGTSNLKSQITSLQRLTALQNLPELQSFDFLHLLGPKAFYNSSHFFLSFEISHPGNLLLQWPVLSQILPALFYF
jgi:hypothetical protein